MDANTLFTLLGSYCFPIVMCLYLTWFLNDEKKSHKAETESLRETLEENTKILTELKTLFEEVRKNG